MGTEAGDGRVVNIAEKMRARLRGAGDSRSQAMMAMKEIIHPLLLAVRNARELCDDDTIGINLGIKREGSDVRFLGEMRVPEFHDDRRPIKVVPYEVRVMVDMLGNPLVIVEACSYSTRTEFRRDSRDPVVAIDCKVRWQGVYDEGLTTSVDELARMVTASAERLVADKERHADAAYPQR